MNVSYTAFSIYVGDLFANGTAIDKQDGQPLSYDDYPLLLEIERSYGRHVRSDGEDAYASFSWQWADRFSKPSAEEINLFYERRLIEVEFNEIEQRHLPGLDGLVDSATAAGHGQQIHVSGQQSHIDALVHVLESGQAAGLTRPPVTILKQPNKHGTVWTETSLRGIVGNLSVRRNAVESAANQLRAELTQLLQIYRSERHGLEVDATDDEVLAEARRLRDRVVVLTGDLQATLRTRIAAVDTATLPSDLETLRSVLIERLEAAATGRQKAIKGALSQQAIDNWAACVEVDQAMMDIARECAIGSLRIRSAEATVWTKDSGTWEVSAPVIGGVELEGEGDPDPTAGADGDRYRDTASAAANAQAAFGAALQAINAVKAVNSPVISFGISGRRVTVRAEHPAANPPIQGPVIEDVSGIGSTDGSSLAGQVGVSAVLPAKDADPRITQYDFADAYAGRVRITMTARNVCGPTEFEVDLDVVADGVIRPVPVQ